MIYFLPKKIKNLISTLKKLKMMIIWSPVQFARLEWRQTGGGDFKSTDRRKPLLLQAVQWLEFDEKAWKFNATGVW